TVKFSFYNFNKEWVAPQTVRINPDDPSDPEVLPNVPEILTILFPALFAPTVFSAVAARDVVLAARNPAPAGNTDDDFIHLSFRYLFWEWNLGRLTAGLDLERPARPEWRWKVKGLLTDPSTEFPTETGIKLDELSAIVPWGAHVPSDSSTDAWLSFDAKGGS